MGKRRIARRQQKKAEIFKLFIGDTGVWGWSVLCVKKKVRELEIVKTKVHQRSACV